MCTHTHAGTCSCSRRYMASECMHTISKNAKPMEGFLKFLPLSYLNFKSWIPENVIVGNSSCLEHSHCVSLFPFPILVFGSRKSDTHSNTGLQGDGFIHSLAIQRPWSAQSNDPKLIFLELLFICIQDKSPSSTEWAVSSPISSLKNSHRCLIFSILHPWYSSNRSSICWWHFTYPYSQCQTLV